METADTTSKPQLQTPRVTPDKCAAEPPEYRSESREGVISTNAAWPTKGEWVVHPEFFIDGGSVVILVEDTLYSIPRHVLKKSEHFSNVLGLDTASSNTDKPAEKPTIEAPFDLCELYPSVNKVDFDSFVEALCSPIYYQSCFTISELQSIARLARLWEFTDLENFAIASLDESDLSATDRLELGAIYELGDWLMQGYIAVCWRMGAVDMAVYDAVVPHLGAAVFLDLQRARRAVWKHLHSIMKVSEGRGYNDCLHSSSPCHTLQQFKDALQMVLDDAERLEEAGNRGEEVELVERLMQDNLAACFVQREDECAYCSSQLQARLAQFIGKDEIAAIVSRIMVPEEAQAPEISDQAAPE